MRPIVFVLFACACGGATPSRLAETPTAQTPRTPTLAPPASDSDKDRYKTNEQFENMQDAQQMRREAGKTAAPPPAPLPPETDDSGSGSAAPPPKPE